jgi:ribonuclease-3
MTELPLFRDRTLLQQALTHRSYINEHPEAGEHNERLEFLGDAVLNFLSGEFLYKRYPDKPEGEMTPLRSVLVDEKQLAKFAIALGIHKPGALRLGRGAELEGGRQNPNLLSSTFEAIIGAYFLDTDSDMSAVRIYVTPLFEAVVDSLLVAAPSVNFKSRLQEWALAKVGENPRYFIIDQSGPDHAREFTAEVRIAGEKYGQGKGRRKQDAEKNAAEDALKNLGLA